MVLSVREMKAAPFRRSEGAEYGVVCYRPPASKARLAFADDVAHAGKILHDLGRNLLSRHAARPDALRRFATAREKSKVRDEKPRPTRFTAIRSSNRLACRQTALQILNRSDVGEIQVLQNFAGAPLPFWTKGELLWSHVAHCTSKHMLQSRQLGMHAV